ncbi:ELOV6 protein, partial [Sula dactylatra]|nr:ELOV6 protein [Sula dactylatra]
SLYFSLWLMILIFGIQHFMEQWRGYELRVPLTLWSLSLAFAIGAHRIWKQMVFILFTKGFKQSVYSQSFYIHSISKFWVYLFVLSKILELGDTMFVVLQKKKLIFLHWYHCITTLIITWYGCKDMVAGGGWLAVLNFSVCTVMYSYYTMQAAGFQVSCFITMAITFSQMLQMLAYIILNVLIIFWMRDKVCHTTWTTVFLSSVLYLSFLVFFCNFFSKNYLRSTQKSKGE